MRAANEQQLRKRRSALLADGLDPADVDEQIANLRVRHTLEETQARERKQFSAFIQLPTTLQARLEDLPAFQNAERSEQAIVERVDADPQIVLTSVTAQSSTFTREDVDQWLAARISDPEAIERLGDRVVSLKSVHVLSVDPMHPLMTTTEIVSLEDALEADAKTLAATPSRIGAFEVHHAIRTYEQQEA